MKKPQNLSARHVLADRVLLKHLESLAERIEGVRKGGDDRDVHQMRVASRRLRNALDLFGDVLPEGKGRRWMKQIKRVTKALGAARDLDVQIAFLEEHLAGLSDADRKRHGPGVERLKLRLTQQRKKKQTKLDKAMDKLEASGVIASLRDHLLAMKARAKLEKTPEVDAALIAEAHERVGERLEEMLSYEGYVHSPEHVEELHEMRIAAKHLRYTLEAYAPLYAGELEAEIELVKQVQSMLGELHDADVWVMTLPAMAQTERERHEEFFGHARGFAAIARGLEHLREERQRKRGEIYAEFVKFYDEQTERGAWRKLRDTLEPPAATADHEASVKIEAKSVESAGEAGES